MNGRFKLLAFSGIVSLLLVLAILWGRTNSPERAPIAATAPALATTPLRAAPGGTPLPTPEPHESKAQTRPKEGRFGGLSTLSAAPIEFYGKVIDQDGRPLPDAEVIAGTGSTTGLMQQETRSYTTSTDANGLFSFQGFRGDGLIIEPKKPDYNFASDRNRFRYSPIDPDKRRFTPDRSHPVVFQMWKILGPEPLISYYGRSVHIPADGTPVMIDLEKGAEAHGNGDLRISVVWGPRSDPSSYAFRWSAKLEIPAGGIMESTGDMMFLAPAEGYEKSLEYNFPAHDKQGELKRIFYVRSRNVYARAEISLQNNPNRGDVSAFFRVQLNPKSGSRNLEPPATTPAYHP